MLTACLYSCATTSQAREEGIEQAKQTWLSLSGAFQVWADAEATAIEKESDAAKAEDRFRRFSQAVEKFEVVRSSARTAIVLLDSGNGRELERLGLAIRELEALLKSVGVL